MGCAINFRGVWPVFAILLPLLLLVTDPVVGFRCWNCNGINGAGGPLCDSGHSGKSLPCLENAENQEFVRCFIMKAVNKLTDALEITKGCLIDNQHFIADIDPMTKQLVMLEPGTCYTHDDDKIYNRGVDENFQVTVCTCNQTDDCNRDTIQDVGWEDNAIKEAADKSRAAGVEIRVGGGVATAVVIMILHSRYYAKGAN